MQITRLDLCAGWTLRQADAKNVEPIPATVPGSVQADLLVAGHIPDPFYGTNEDRVQWVGQAAWEYRIVFEAPELPGPDARAALVFEGLDTFATITLNGRPVGTADNMFRPWRFDVTDALAAGKNELVVRFDSAEAKADEAAAAYGFDLPQTTQSKPHRGFVRKAQCHFGWDWGPQLVCVGLWRPVRLEIVPRARIAGLDAWGEPGENGAGTLGLSVEVGGPRPEGLALECVATSPEGDEVGRVRVPVEDGRATARIALARAALWWPAGLGAQPLYGLDARLVDGEALVDRTSVRVGIRRLELVREPDEWGESFHFRANGVDFFAKGANWVPADALPTRMTPGRYRRLLADGRDAGMNMLRVWGGGFYEDPAFYHLCDEMGLLVWQDFMYACALYPGDDDAFLAGARAEAEWVVRRLRRHTSLALWCGNNECEEGWHFWGWKDACPPRVWQGYLRLFHEMLPAVVAEHDRRRPYIPSSPHSTDSHERGDARGEASGDCHVWSVWFGSLDGRTYIESGARFASEFGFQSFPPLATLRAALPVDAMRIDSPAMLHHQRSKDGNAKILEALRTWAGEPRDFAALVYLSQVYQARTLRLGVEHFRRAAPRTMGTLYWQANDCWPVASWSSLDYHGRWKALHYAARRFYAPLLVSGLADETGATFWATADFGAEPREAEVAWQVLRWDGAELENAARRVTLRPGTTARAARIVWDDLGARPEEVYVAAALRDPGAAEPWSRALVLPVAPVRVALPDPGLELAPEGENAVRVRARNVALAVALEAEGEDGRFEDSFFNLLPGEARVIRWTGAALGPVVARTLDAASMR